jgi:hypothetical protein
MPITSDDLVLETGEGEEDSNTYVTVSGADVYHAGLGHDAWAEYDEDERAQALLDAAQYMSARWSWVGQRVTSGQAMDWPRLGAYDADRFLWEDAVPPAVVKAQCEYALLAVSGTTLYPTPGPGEQGAITSRSETIGPHTESVSYARPLRLDLPRYPAVDRILTKAGLIRGKRQWTVRN